MFASLDWAILASFFQCGKTLRFYKDKEFLDHLSDFASKTLSCGVNVVLSRAVNLKLAHLKLVTSMKLFHVCCHDLIVWP